MPHYYYYVVDCWLLYARICHSDMFSNRSEKSDTNPLIWQFSWSEMVDGHFRSTFYAKLENKKIDTIHLTEVGSDSVADQRNTMVCKPCLYILWWTVDSTVQYFILY